MSQIKFLPKGLNKYAFMLWMCPNDGSINTECIFPNWIFQFRSPFASVCASQWTNNKQNKQLNMKHEYSSKNNNNWISSKIFVWQAYFSKISSPCFELLENRWWRKLKMHFPVFSIASKCCSQNSDESRRTHKMENITTNKSSLAFVNSLRKCWLSSPNMQDTVRRTFGW